MYKKTLNVRLVKTSDTSCYVEYSYHRIFPEWTPVTEWMYMLRSWNTVVLPYEAAKAFAERFQTIEDVQAWVAEQEALRAKYPEAKYDTPIIEYIKGGE